MIANTMKTTTILLGALGLLAAGASSVSAQSGYVMFPAQETHPVLSESERFVRPISSPYYHEDAFITTDLRAWYVYHKFPRNTLGGDATVAAAQVRLALTESLQLVVYKGGWIDFDDGVVRENGWNDHAAGLKWAFYQDWEQQLHLAAGLGWQIPTGKSDVLQNNNALRLWLSANKGIDRLHLGATANFIRGFNGSEHFGAADQLMLHFHADYFINRWFSPVVEANVYLVTKERDGSQTPFQGLDVANISGGKDDDVVTLALGGEFRPFGPNIGIRAAYETTVKKGDASLFNYRWTISSVIEF